MTPIVDELLNAIGHQQHGRLALAESIYRDVIDREPEQASALYLYGMLQLKDGRATTAASLLERASRLRPDAEIHLHLARARLASGQAQGALAAIDGAIHEQGRSSEALYLQGTALSACGRPEEAVLSFTEAAARNPRHAATRLNLGNALADLDRLDEAEAHIRAALALDPTLVEALASLGYVLGRHGRLAEAIQACEQAVALDPESGHAHWNMATALLLSGDFRRGFREYEWRKRHSDYSGHFSPLPGPTWAGEPLAGRTLLIHAEQGFGDTIQLARYAPMLSRLGAQVVLACARSLVPLLYGQAGLADVVPRNGRLPAYDYWVDQMSLPRLLDTTADTVPGAAGYLVANDTRSRVWAGRHPEARIGLVWAGNPAHSNDRRRSIPRSAMRPLVRPDAISLQVGPRAAEADTLGLATPVGGLPSYAETAALIATLDLVITVDTSVAHLAGAMGVPVWIMLPHAPDWRWLAGRDDTPWYSSARLFRQETPGDWAGVIARVKAALPA